MNLAKLALAAIGVASSEMKRAADLRYRTDAEALSDDVSPLDLFRNKSAEIVNDLDATASAQPAAECVSHSALTPPIKRECVDLVITSPPYVNGTNYFRNTKIELWLAGIIKSESDLAALRDSAMAAGINDISRRGRAPIKMASVESIALQLDAVAYDPRIPELIRRYFSDSRLWLSNVAQLAREGAKVVVDIGDSRFAGIHVPADEILIEIAAKCSLRLVESRHVRNRRSKDGETLKQTLLVLEKRERGCRSSAVASATSDRRRAFLNAAVEFSRELPHQRRPYASRNWGHPLHSLCSYQGKLKPAIAHFLVERFSLPGEKVLDPNGT